MLEVMLPNLAPVQTPPAPVRTPPASVQTPAPAQIQAPAVAKPQRVRVQAPVQDEAPAPVVVNKPPVVDATLVAAVINTPTVVDQVETPMETNEDELLAKLFFKKYGRALPEETEKEKESDVDQIKFVIDLTDDTDEMEADPTPILIPNQIVKSEPIEAAEAPEAPVSNVANVNNFANANSVYNESGIRVSRRLARKAITEFGKSLRKSEVISEKEAPLAAGTENVIATDDTDMAEDVSVNEANTVNPVGPVKTYEQVMAEIDAAIEDNTE